MTRINLIPPSLICDQHLVAEIKEINQLSGSFSKSLLSLNGLRIHDIPVEFTLNTGHVRFFYDKGRYLANRFSQLKTEAIHRGFNVTASFNNPWLSHTTLHNDWTPTYQAYCIIIERIISKIESKPTWYRMSGVTIDADTYIKNLHTWLAKQK